MKNPPVETIYNLLVQMDYLAGLGTATILGLCLGEDLPWSMFLFALVVSMGLGIITVRVYIKMLRHIVSKKK